MEKGLMIGAIVYLAVAFAAACAFLAAVAVLIARTDRGDERAAINQVCDEMDERLLEPDEPVPYWPAIDKALTTHAGLLAAICDPCDPCNGGTGECVCPAQCGELECTGGFSDEDIQFLKGLTMPEGTDQ